MKPMIFNSEMVRAVLDGRKTQTRRVIKSQPHIEIDHWENLAGAYDGWVGCNKNTYPKENIVWPVGRSFESVRCPYGRVGEKLWVRETWRCTGGGSLRNIIYRAEDDSAMSFCGVDDGRSGILRVPESHWAEWDRLVYETNKSCNWRPSIHMYKWVSRITLEITNIRVERVTEISREDAVAEGIIHEACHHGHSEVCTAGCRPEPEYKFRDLWDFINAKRGYGWDKNPWVWVIEFRRIDK